MLLKQVTPNVYKKIKTPADVPLTATLDISGELVGVTCFRASIYVTITNDIYNQGYIELERPTYAPGVTMMAVDGPILLNKAASGPWADFEVYDKYVFFRNDITAGGYTSSGLTEIVEVGDEYIVEYGFSATSNLRQHSFTITSTDVSRGYALLPFRVVSPAFATAFVVGGTTLTNAGAYTNATGDFVIWGEKFIFKNGVTIHGYVSSGLSELISEGDTIVLLSI